MVDEQCRSSLDCANVQAGLDLRFSHIFLGPNSQPPLGRVKHKRAFEHVQNMLIHIILRMRKVSAGLLHSIDTFYNI